MFIKNRYMLCFGAVLIQLAIVFLSIYTCDIPGEYACHYNASVFNELHDTVKKELHIIEYTKNIGHNNTDKAISLVLNHDKTIVHASNEYDVPKEMIQAVLFKELRMIDFRDDIADSFVDNCFKINKHLSQSKTKNIFTQLALFATDTCGSSTGIGQIFPETAIKAHNWYINNYNDAEGNILNYNDTRDREDIWRALQDDETNIYYIALVMKYEAEHNLDININDVSDKNLRGVFIRYNGASYYGYEVLKYYNLFCEIKPTSIKNKIDTQLK